MLSRGRAGLLMAALLALPAAANDPDLPDAVAIEVPDFGDFLTTDGDTVWMTNIKRIERWSIGGRTASVAVPRPCGAPVVAFEALWVTDCETKSLVRIDRRRATVTARIPTGIADPDGEMSLAAGAGAIWMATDPTGIVSRIDPAKNRVVATIKVAPESRGVAFGFGSAWVTNAKSASVQRIDVKSDRVVATIPVGKSPGFITTGEGAVWVQNQADGTVTRIDPKHDRVAATIKVGRDLIYGDIATGAGRVWVRTTGDQLLAVIDPWTNRIVARLGKPRGSGAVRYGGGRVWVTAHDVHRLWAIKR